MQNRGISTRAIAMCLVVALSRASIAFEPTIRPRHASTNSTPAKEPGPGSVPVFAHQASADSTAGSLIEANRQHVQKYEQALQLVGQKKFGESLGLLQEILDSAGDGFVIDRVRPAPTAIGLKSSAEQLVAQIVRRDRDAYERAFGSTARALYNSALSTNDVEQLKAVARRFLHTRAGGDAAYRLANIYFDHNQPSLAAAWHYRALGSSARSAKRQINVVLQLAVCELHAGNPDAARAILSQQRAASPNGLIASGDRRFAWFDSSEDPLNWLREKFALDSAAANAASELLAGWKSSMLEADSILVDAISSVRRGGSLDAAMPAPRLRSIVAGNVVVSRTLDRIVAVDAKTGSPLWELPVDEAFDAERAANKRDRRKRPSHVVLKLVEQRLDHDATYGTITSDGHRVFSIDGLGLAFGYRDARANQYVLPSATNRLVARDLQTGDVAWKCESADTFFLGSPTAVDGELYVLAEVGGQTKLLVLEAAKGKPLWSQALVTPGFNIVQDFHRRLTGLAPAVLGDVIICPTGTGSIVALERTGRSLLWSYTPAGGAEHASGDLPLANINRHPASGKWDWLDSSVLVTQDKVIAKPRGFGEICCLDFKTGSLVWKVQCEDALFTAGIANGNVVVVHPRNVTALQLANGSTAWTTPVGPAAGRGFIQDAKLNLPLAKGEIATIDLTNGHLDDERKVAKPNTHGNLTAIPGGAISQTAFSLHAFPLAAEGSDVAATGLPIITPSVAGNR